MKKFTSLLILFVLFFSFLQTTFAADWNTENDDIFYDIGKVGIGTNSPTADLHVEGYAFVDGSFTLNGAFNFLNSNGFVGYFTSNAEDDFKIITNHGIDITSGLNEPLRIRTFGYPNPEETKIQLNPIGDSYFIGGNVGIGTTDPGDYKLAVEGTIGAREIVVNNDSWADYVFEENYKLPSLSDVEAHIKAKKHLPDIPTAADVKENGIPMGQMQVKLLKKIEELTLYTIEQNKELAQLREENIQWERRLADIEQKLNKEE
jgi:hypothetical protein